MPSRRAAATNAYGSNDRSSVKHARTGPDPCACAASLISLILSPAKCDDGAACEQRDAFATVGDRR